MKDSANQTSGTAKRAFRSPAKRYLVVFGLVTSALLAANIVLSIGAMHKYVAVSQALADTRQHVIVPAGGIDYDKPTLLHGGIWWFNDSFCIDVICPTFRQGFMVPIEPGKETEFIAHSLMESQGYKPRPPEPTCRLDEFTYSCTQSGFKGKINLSVSVSPADTASNHAPLKDISPKIWRYVSIRSEYY